MKKNTLKTYVIVTSHRSEVSNAPSNNVIRMSSVGVVETYLNEYVTEMSSLDAIFSCSIYDVADKCYFGGVELKHKNYVIFRCGLNSTTAELHGDVIGRCIVLSYYDFASTK